MINKKAGFLIDLTLFFGIMMLSINTFSMDFKVVKNP
jgi:hypothetical protein